MPAFAALSASSKRNPVGVGLLPLFRRVGCGRRCVRHAASGAMVDDCSFVDPPLQLLRDRERWPLWLPVGLGAGIAIYFALPFEPPLGLGGVGGACSASRACSRCRERRTRFFACFSSLAAATLLGFAIAKARTEFVAAPVPRTRVGPIGIDGRVEQSELHGKGVRIILGELTHARRFVPEIRQHEFAFLSEPKHPCRRRAVGCMSRPSLMPPPSPAAPGAYDFGRAAYYMRLGGVGYAYGRLTPQSSR